MTASIIADSSGIVSLISETDSNHSVALKLTDTLRDTAGSIIVPSDVFSETLNVIGRKIGHEVAVTVGQEIIDSDVYVVLEANEKVRQRAFEIFKVQPGSVSFTDSVVMAFADQFNTKDIFGYDEAFRKNGYTRLGFDKG
jgi:predicted nucleic acid-binding protein